MKDKPYGAGRSKNLRLLSILAVFLLAGFFCIAPVSAADILQIPVPSGDVVEGVTTGSSTDTKSSVIVKSLPSSVTKGSTLTISGYAVVADMSSAVVMLKSSSGAEYKKTAFVKGGSFEVTFETISMDAGMYAVSVTVAGKTSDVGTVKIVEPTVYTQKPVETETPVYTQAPISSKPINEKVTKGSTLTLSGTMNTDATYMAGDVELNSGRTWYVYPITIDHGSWVTEIDTSKMDVGVYTIYVIIAGTESTLGTVEIVEPTPIYTQAPVETETPVYTQAPQTTPTVTVNPYPASVTKGSILEISGTKDVEIVGIEIFVEHAGQVVRWYPSFPSLDKWIVDIDTSKMDAGRYSIYAIFDYAMLDYAMFDDDAKVYHGERVDIGTVEIVEPKPTDPTPTPTPTATETGKPMPTGSAVEKPVETQKDYEKIDGSEGNPAGVPVIFNEIVNWFMKLFSFS